MAKYTLSDRQKSAVKALSNTMDKQLKKKEKQKIGKVSYTAYEISVFSFKEEYKYTASYVFDRKNANFSKRWKRSWNSIPTLTEIKQMAKSEYDKDIEKIRKKIHSIQNKVAEEQVKLNNKAMSKFYVELDKAKKSKKQTKNVKELLAVESIVSKKMYNHFEEIFKEANYYFDFEYDKKELKEVFSNKVKESFEKKEVSFEQEFSFHKDLGYGKEVLDMRGEKAKEADMAYQIYCFSKDKKRYESAIEAAKKEKVEDTKWFIKYYNMSFNFRKLLNTDFSIQKDNIRSYCSEIDIWEPQRESLIYTLNMSMDKNGNVKQHYDSLQNDSWSYIPKGYEWNVYFNIVILFAFMSNKTKSFITDDRKLKTLKKELEKAKQELRKIKDLQDDIYI